MPYSKILFVLWFLAFGTLSAESEWDGQYELESFETPDIVIDPPAFYENFWDLEGADPDFDGTYPNPNFFVYAPAVVTGAKGKRPKSVLALGDSVTAASFSAIDVWKWDVMVADKLIQAWKKDPKTELKPKLNLYSEKFVEFAKKQKLKLENVTRLYETPEERNLGFFEKLALRNKNGLMGNLLDVEQYSWIYQLAMYQGVAPEQVFIAAEAGRHSNNASTQAQRYLRALKNQLPDFVFMFFTGNDLCSMNMGTNAKAAAEKFKNNIVAGLKEFIDKGKVAKEAVADLFVVTHLPVWDLLDEENEKKEVFAYGDAKKMSCKKLRSEDRSNIDITNKLSKFSKSLVDAVNLARKFKNQPPYKNLPPMWHMCRSILSPYKNADEKKKRVAKVKELATALQASAKVAVLELRKYADEKFKKGTAARKQFRINVLSSTAKLDFKPQHFAEDCFHPSPKGHGLIADALDKELKDKNFVSFEEAQDFY